MPRSRQIGHHSCQIGDTFYTVNSYIDDKALAKYLGRQVNTKIFLKAKKKGVATGTRLLGGLILDIHAEPVRKAKA